METRIVEISIPATEKNKNEDLISLMQKAIGGKCKIHNFMCLTGLREYLQTKTWRFLVGYSQKRKRKT